jgi:monothiol glutaredoxin
MQFNDSRPEIRLDFQREAARKEWRSTPMDVNERIKSQLASYPVLLYMKGTPDFPQCGFSAKTVSVLRAIGARFAYINIFEDPEIREGLKTYSNWPTFPQLYVNGELIGGCDITVELYESGELKEIIDAAAPAPQPQ